MVMAKERIIMRLIKDHILRKVHDHVVLVPLTDSETDFKGMIALNDTGEFVCRLLEEDTDKDALAASLAQAYDIEVAQAAADVEAFLKELESCRMIVG